MNFIVDVTVELYLISKYICVASISATFKVDGKTDWYILG